MPQLGETVTEGTITRWLKAVGDNVAEDEVLFEVSTDKVDSEVPSPAAGVVSEILVAEGDTVDVGTKLAVVSDSAGSAGPAGGEMAEDSTPEPKPEGEAEMETAAATIPEPEAEPPDGEAASTSADTAPPMAASETAPPAATPLSDDSAGSQDEPAGGGGANKVLSPVVRRLLSEHQLDPGQITGSGSGGRITRSDVLAVIDQQSAAGGRPAAAQPPKTASTAPAEAPAPAPVAPAPPAVVGDRDTVVKFTNIRKRTAEHMVRSKHTSAHTMVAVEVDYFAVESVRGASKARFKEAEGFGLTYLPFVCRAVVDALSDFPHVNSSVGDNELIVHNDINLGIAVDINFEGLLVPVIHQADGKRLRQLARDVSDLASRARTKKLTMDDIAGGTLTITNPGPFGTLLTVPVINQPQVAILSTDGVRKRPVVIDLPDGSDGIAVHPVGNLVMSWDHRAFDGAYAAAFVHEVKEILETRDWSVEL